MTGFSIMKRKKALSIGIDVLYYSLIGTASLILLTVFVWVFVADQFVIKGESMEPGLTSGDHILVNKLLMGARIYKDYDFSLSDNDDELRHYVSGCRDSVSSDRETLRFSITRKAGKTDTSDSRSTMYIAKDVSECPEIPFQL